MEQLRPIISAVAMAVQSVAPPPTATAADNMDLKVELVLFSGEKRDWWTRSRVHHARTRPLGHDEAFNAHAEEAVKVGLAGSDT